jgi:hypothetical protein
MLSYARNKFSKQSEELKSDSLFTIKYYSGNPTKAEPFAGEKGLQVEKGT